MWKLPIDKPAQRASEGIGIVDVTSRPLQVDAIHQSGGLRGMPLCPWCVKGLYLVSSCWGCGVRGAIRGEGGLSLGDPEKTSAGFTSGDNLISAAENAFALVVDVAW